MTDSGIALLRFDFTGLGQSEGDFADTNLSSNVSDLLAAVRFLTENYRAPEILLGHSLGGTAILQAAAGIPSAVTTWLPTSRDRSVAQGPARRLTTCCPPHWQTAPR